MPVVTLSYATANEKVMFRGSCQSCRRRLRNIDITDDEFKKLSKHFLEKIFIEENILIKSTPEELGSFVAFFNKTGPYHCVIDGLNVGHFNNATNPTAQSKYVSSSVQCPANR